MEKRKVLIAAPVHSALTDGLVHMGYECVFHMDITQETAYTIIGDCSGVVTSTRLLLNKTLLDAAPRLEWIGRMGSGMEIIDVTYAQIRNIACYSSPEGNCNAVGEHAVGMLLDLVRKIKVSAQEIAGGIWRRDENRGIELEGKTIAIVGFGHTGRSFAKKLSGFDMNILAIDNAPLQDVPHYVRVASWQEAYNEADIISYHVPLTGDTFHYFNNNILPRFRKPVILINTSRGKVVELEAVYEGLINGRLAGACLDVFEEEPIGRFTGNQKQMMEQITSMVNVVLTPHIAGYTWEALYKMSTVLLHKISSSAKA